MMRLTPEDHTGAIYLITYVKYAILRLIGYSYHLFSIVNDFINYLGFKFQCRLIHLFFYSMSIFAYELST